jgi:hypothetical protein
VNSFYKYIKNLPQNLPQKPPQPIAKMMIKWTLNSLLESRPHRQTKTKKATCDVALSILDQ